MKLYSSTFISIILGFLLFLNNQGEQIVAQEGPMAQFKRIVRTEALQKKENITVNVFETFNCEKCKPLALNTLPELKEKLAGKAELKIIMVPKSDEEYIAVSAAKCAANQEGFWAVHAELHDTSNFSRRNINTIARNVGLNVDELNACIDEDPFFTEISDEKNHADDLNLPGFPTTIVENVTLIGNQPVENILKVVDDLTL